MRVLIAAADLRSAASIKAILAEENLICDTTDLGEDGVQISSLYDYDIILLDLMLADIEGYKMLRRLRAARVHTPILILSARSQLDEKVKFLRVGADDFLTKPFESRELTARILAIVRRSKGYSESTIRTGKLAVNLDTRVVSVGDQAMHLTPKEYSLLELLSLRKGTPVRKESILNHLYEGMEEPESKITDVFVCKLRKKLARATGGSHYIETVWGCGYVLREPAEGPAAAPVAGAEDLAAPHDRADNAAAAECTVTEGVRPTPGGAPQPSQIEPLPTNYRDGVRDHPANRKRASRSGSATERTRLSFPVEVRFEDALTTDGGPLRVPRPDPARSLFGCATARCHE
jgi:two-component system cell cycle response regulator CtrA